ncbi:MAG: nitroreductase family protein [Muribaculaceae bacterium]|nr:nitroreductase family protein [Muribaculaceae bacterium]
MNLDFFSNRRSIRRFSDKHISNEMLNEMLLAASHAPTMGNMQLYSVIITRDEEQRKALAPAHFSQPAMTGAPVLLTFCADFNRFVKWCEQRSADHGYDNFQMWMCAVLDTACVAQQFCTIAEMQGLGTCYLGTTTYNAPLIAEVLNLPTRVVPVTTVALGYPADSGEEVGRLPLEAWVHTERYVDYTPAKIDSIYAEKEAREDSQRFVAENGKENLAQVFTDVRYRKPDNEYFSQVYLDFIASHGFPLPEK